MFKPSTVYYLEMLSPSQRVVAAPRDDLTVLFAHTISVDYYRFLYDAVGGDYNWMSRRKLSDEALAEIIQDPPDETHVLYVDGSPAGFAELNRRQPNEIELIQFGLFPGFIGQGLGKWFLQWTIDKAWSYAPNRVWLHTCTFDHPAAFPNYKQAGFDLYKEETIQQEC